MSPRLDRVAAVEVGDRARDAQDPVAAARAERADGRRRVRAPRRRRRRAGLPRTQPRASISPLQRAPVPARRGAGARGPRSRARAPRPSVRRAGRGSSSPVGRSTSTSRSMRSSSGPLSRRRWRRRSASPQRAALVHAGEAARARVGGGDQHERASGTRARCWPRTIVTRPSSSGWRSASRLGALELGQLVEEQHAVVGQRRLARAAAASRRRPGPAAEIVWCGARNGRALIRPPAWRPATLWIRVTSIASARRQRRQDRRQAPGQHRLAGARRRPPAAGCDRPRRRSPGPAAAPRGRARRRGRARADGRRGPAARPGGERRRRRPASTLGGGPQTGAPPTISQALDERRLARPRCGGTISRAQPGPRCAPSATASAPGESRSSPPSDSSPNTA